jgi:hypothetical protein
MITKEYLVSKYTYDENIGIFQKKNSEAKIGFNDHGYTRIEINGKSYYAHRLAWLYVYGEMPKLHLDHINGNKSDNRICNLREATRVENLRNTSKNIKNTSGAKNVYLHKPTDKWQVRIALNGKSKHFGLFDDFELADLVAIEARNKYHGQFARG